MPFSLRTLQKLAKLVNSDDESQAVAEKIGMKKDALTTLLEAQQAGEVAVEAQAASCMDQLQEAYNHLTSENVLDWLNAVDATEASDTPELRLQAGEESDANIRDQAEQSDQVPAVSATLGDPTLLGPMWLLLIVFRLSCR